MVKQYCAPQSGGSISGKNALLSSLWHVFFVMHDISKQCENMNTSSSRPSPKKKAPVKHCYYQSFCLKLLLLWLVEMSHTACKKSLKSELCVGIWIYLPLSMWTLTETVSPRLGEHEYVPESEGIACWTTRKLAVMSPFSVITLTPPRGES